MRRVGAGDAREGGRPLVAAHQDSDSLMVFRIEGATGTLTPVGRPVPAPVPVCV
ncbi:MAG: beta-propeller fold lactonase family protein, partial [Acidobacteria bacterium]|nr:beta-propeller fold lactonase family protein [Bryobacteraceae bacterium CoA2 C42]